MSVEPLTAAHLFHRCDPAQFDFQTTAELEELTEVIGQHRAIEAVRFGVGIRREGYNLYVMGPPGVGKHTLIGEYLKERAKDQPAPPDWVYVNNFEHPDKPQALRLAAGQGQRLRQDMEHFIEELAGSIPAAFESDEYRNHIQNIEDELKERQEKGFAELSEEAGKHSIKLFRTPSGFAFAPMRDGEVVGPEEFAKWSQEQQTRTEQVVSVLQERLQRILQQIPAWRRETRERVKALNKEVTMSVVGHLIDELKASYAELPPVVAWLDALRQDVVDNVKDFLKPEDGSEGIPGQQQESDPRGLHRYKVNVMVDNSKTKGAPVTYLDNPTYLNLVGRAEHVAQYGALLTDFTLLKPGSLHAASGGYLVVDAHKLLTHVYAWEGLKRALYANEIRIESLEKLLSLVSTVSLEPEAIPLNVKVVLVGDRMLYYLLHAYDPDFAELFKVTADFEGEIDRTEANNQLYARFVATLTKKDKLRPFERGAVARIIEHGARLVEDSEKLSTHMRSIADVLREADYWAGEAQRDIVCAEDVQRAIDHQIFRVSRVRERIQEEIRRNTIYIDTSGERVGQINGLSVLSVGNFAFGQPSRITATVHIGEGHVIDIEREVELGGPIHSKGVLILSSFMASRYAQNHPLSLSAGLVFEQSYGGVDGDSASLAELCALLSALSGEPIRQSFAMTGSVNQHGQVQPIGGVNEKVEGFFDVCVARGLTGDQGVLIPASNVKHLMLRHDVVQACAEGRFRLFAVETVDQAIELLTGTSAGTEDADGHYPEDSINGRVQARLTEMSLIRQTFAEQAKEKLKGEDDEPGIKLNEP